MSRAQEVCDRVYAVGGYGLSGSEDCCVYLVDAGSELIMIDTGAGSSLNRIEKNIRSAGFEPAQIRHIIATHCHIDHIGGLASMVHWYGSKVIAHELDRPGIEGENNDLTAAAIYGIDYQPVKVDILIKGEAETLLLGDLEFNFVHTPGHTPGSMSPYIDTKTGGFYSDRTYTGRFPPPGAPTWQRGGSPWRSCWRSRRMCCARGMRGFIGEIRWGGILKDIWRDMEPNFRIL